MAQLEDCTPSLILTDKLSAQEVKDYDAAKAKIIVEEVGTRKLIEVWVIRAATFQPEVSIVHPAAQLEAVEPEHYKVFLRLRRDDCTAELYKAFGNKSTLSRLVGPAIAQLDLMHKRLLDEPEAISWAATVHKDHLQVVLHESGRNSVLISLDRADEARLRLQSIFFEAADVDKAWHLVSALPHFGMWGPTRSGQYLLRCPKDALSEARRLLLGDASLYSRKWDLVPSLHYQILLPSTISPRLLVDTLYDNFGWVAVIAQVKKQNKGAKLLTLAADQPLRHTELLLDKELLILTPVKTTAANATGFQTSFSAPQAPQSSAGSSAPSTSASSAIDIKCEQAFSAMDISIAQKIAALSQKAEASWEQSRQELVVAMDQLKDDTARKLDAFQAASVAQHQRASEDTTEKLAAMQAACDRKFDAVDQTLQDQSAKLSAATATYEAQLNAWGEKFMLQMANMQSAPKRRMTHSEGTMDTEDGLLHRGGGGDDPPGHVKLASKLEELSARLMQQVASVGHVSSSSQASAGMSPFRVRRAATAQPFTNPSLSSTSGSTAGALPRTGSSAVKLEAKAEMKLETKSDVKQESQAVTKVEVAIASTVTTSSSSSSAASSTTSSSSETIKSQPVRDPSPAQDSCFPGGPPPPELPEQTRGESPPPPRWAVDPQYREQLAKEISEIFSPEPRQASPILVEDSPENRKRLPGTPVTPVSAKRPRRPSSPKQRYSRRCTPATESSVNDDIQTDRAAAVEEKRHVLYLLSDMFPVQPMGVLPEWPQAAHQRQIQGYAVSCWLCGLVQPVAKWKTVVRWRCGMWPILRNEVPRGQERILQGESTRQQLQDWLAQANLTPERRDLHWPSLTPITAEDGSQQWILQCSKCSIQSTYARKKAFMAARCRPKDGVQDPFALRCEQADPVKRGGFRVASLNVGTLCARVQLLALLPPKVWCLQEVCVPVALRPSIKSAFVNLEARLSSVMSPLRIGDAMDLLPWFAKAPELLWWLSRPLQRFPLATSSCRVSTGSLSPTASPLPSLRDPAQPSSCTPSTSIMRTRPSTILFFLILLEGSVRQSMRSM